MKTVEEVLSSLLQEDRDKFLCNEKLLKAFLKDYCMDQNKEINGVMSAFQIDLPNQILRNKQKYTNDNEYKKLIRQMKREIGLEEELAEWTVLTWANALGVRAGEISRPVSRKANPTRRRELQINRLLKEHVMSVKNIKTMGCRSKYWSLSDDRSIVIWDENLEVVHKVRIDVDKLITCVEISPCENFVAVGFKDGSVEIWSQESKCLVSEVKNSKYEVIQVGFVGSLNHVFALYEDGGMNIFRSFDGFSLRKIDSQESIIKKISYSSERGYILIIGDNDRLRVYKMSVDEMEKVFSERVRGITCASFTGDGTKVVVGSVSGEVKLFDIEEKRVVKTFKTHNRNISSVAISNDNNKIAAYISNSKIIQVDEGESNETMRELKLYSTAINEIIYTYNDENILCACGDCNIRVLS